MIAADIGQTPGAWRRAGQVGSVVGLDWSAVEVLMPRDVDREPVIELLKDFEAGMLAGIAEKAKERGGG